MTNRDGGNDDRRAMPPADPWLESAPTSSFEPVPDDTYPGEAPPRRARGFWWPVAAAVALLACAGGVLLNPFDDDDDPAGRALPTTRPSVTAASAGPAPRASTAPLSGDLVVYLVTSNRKGEVASVEYTDQDSDHIRKGEVSLPWRHTFRLTGEKHPLVLIAQRKSGGAGPVTCSISLGGKELTTAVQRGRYAAPQCSA
ncbi:hypothetical protein [Paractinoplanes rishiriensis]|uniref:hypothetical protein n=1 Tax=Paractinoplanes rishiriensis TaxID=1050105 RepID=UPI0019437EB4|nr:hypothetical protein [Actinoplanes rishiriensis]